MTPATLREGSTGAAVIQWQETLNSAGASLVVDGDFGPKTKASTRAYQRERGLVPDGIVGPKTWGKSREETADTEPPPGGLPQIKFVEARNYTRVAGHGAGVSRRIDLLVVHSMEAAEASTTAERVAAWFAGASAPKASAHYCLDSDSIVQCVEDRHVAWHAPGANHNGIGFELAGYARQTRDEWFDAFSAPMLTLLAQLLAQKCDAYGIPVRHCDVTALKAGGARGITTHSDVSQAFRKSTHWDPGPGFPMDHLLERIEHHRRLA